jgi:hypothetical protein
VPRAKRTDRAEARRRHRAALAAQGIEPDDTEAESPAETRSTAPARPTTTFQRPSITRAFREAFHPVNLREDLRELPSLIRHRAVWLPALIILVVAILFVATRGTNEIIVLVVYYMLLPPAMGPAFIGGFMAPRASYIVGFILGIASAGAYTVALAVAVPNLPTTPNASVSLQDQAIFAFTSSPIFGIFFAAAAAWYRRFLRLSSPNRYRQQQAPKRADGRTRATRSQQGASSRR